MFVAGYIKRMGGLASTQQIYDHGRWWQSLIQEEVWSGSIVRVRKGWYATPETPPPLVEACRQRGRLTCISALQFLEGREVSLPLHIAVDRHAGRVDPAEGTIVHWTGSGAGGTNGVVSAAWARQEAARCWASLSARSAPG